MDGRPSRLSHRKPNVRNPGYVAGEGFTYDRPKGQGNCVMVREVAGLP